MIKQTLKLSLLILLFSWQATGREKRINNFDSTIQPLISKYCIECHGTKKVKGGIDFSKLGPSIKNASEAEKWQEVLDVLNTAEMPPEDEEKPSGEELEEFIRSLSKDTNDAAELFSGSTKSMLRRINKREYINIIQDSLGVFIPEDEVLDELIDSEFDTISSSLFTSQANLDVYMINARNTVRSFIQLYTSNSEFQLNYRLGKVKGLSQFFFGSVSHKRIPSGDYSLNLKLWSGNTGGKPYYFRLGKRSRMVTGTKEAPQTITINFKNMLEISNKYVFSPAKPFLSEREIEKIRQEDKDEEDKPKKKKYPAIRPDGKNGRPFFSVSEASLQGKIYNHHAKTFFKSLDAYARPGDKNGTPVPDKHCRLLFEKFAQLMYRREVPSSTFIDKLENIYQKNRRGGMNFWNAIVEPMSLVLVSPKFLYVSNSEKLTAMELANRLALFLWSSVPDTTLSKKAANGNLSRSDLEVEVERVISDKKAMRFFESFHSQWLELDRYDMIAVNSQLYPDFNDYLRLELKKETVYFIKELIDKNLPIRNLISSDFIMANNHVAQYYGLSLPDSHDFKKIKLPNNSPYGGIITSAAVMTLNSNGERSSPVERGAWVLRKILGDPPLPAPPNVPELEAVDSHGKTAREALKNHTRTPQCAACHRKMDEIGFGFEEFDAIGKIRSIERRLIPERKDSDKLIAHKVRLDPRGMFNGKSYTGHRELKAILVNHQDKLARTYITALLSYALGRKIGFAETKEVDAIVETCRQDGFRMRSIIKNVVKSELFRRK